MTAMHHTVMLEGQLRASVACQGTSAPAGCPTAGPWTEVGCWGQHAGCARLCCLDQMNLLNQLLATARPVDANPGTLPDHQLGLSKSLLQSFEGAETDQNGL